MRFSGDRRSVGQRGREETWKKNVYKCLRHCALFQKHPLPHAKASDLASYDAFFAIVCNGKSSYLSIFFSLSILLTHTIVQEVNQVAAALEVLMRARLNPSVNCRSVRVFVNEINSFYLLNTTFYHWFIHLCTPHNPIIAAQMSPKHPQSHFVIHFTNFHATFSQVFHGNFESATQTPTELNESSTVTGGMEGVVALPRWEIHHIL